MIFAAGLGTRLRPITDRIPKALVHAGDKTLLQWVTEKMIRSGIRDVVINIHHFPDQIRAFLERNNNFGINIQFSDESDAILDTGLFSRRLRCFRVTNQSWCTMWMF